MSASARVHSLDALKELREKLCAFGVDAQEALCSTELEIRRVFDWLQSRAKHWQHAVRECQEEVVRAKSELTRRKYGQGSGPGPGCTDQEIALRKAQEKLRQAEEKVENCRRWSRNLPQAITEYHGPARQFGGFLEADLKHSAALLERKIAALEAYVAVPSATHSGPADTGPAQGAMTP